MDGEHDLDVLEYEPAHHTAMQSLLQGCTVLLNHVATIVVFGKRISQHQDERRGWTGVDSKMQEPEVTHSASF